MDTKHLFLAWIFVAAILLMEVHRGFALKEGKKVKKPPDPDVKEELDKEQLVNSQESNNETTTDDVKKIGNLDDADELLGQETIQSELNDISTTTTVNPKFRKFARPLLPYYPTRYLFRLKPKIRQNNRISLKSTNVTVSGSNGTVSEAMLKWRSRYNYIFRRRGSTPPKPTYLKKYKSSHLIGSESSNHSRKLRRNYSRNRNYRTRRKKARNYSYVRRVSKSRFRNGRSGSSRRRYRGKGLKASGSSTSYTSRFFPSAQVINSNAAVPGKPNIDYPAFRIIPKTSFTCDKKVGNFPDYEARCQLWHMCYGGGLHSSFLCPNGTVFNQKVSVCDWWYKVSCQ